MNPIQMRAVMEMKLRAVMEGAKENLNKDHRLAPVALLSEGDHLKAQLIMPWKDDGQKQAMLKKIGTLCKEKNCDNVIIISDAAMKQMDTLEQAKDPLERPLLYPESLRQECIIVIGHDFRTSRTYSLIQVYQADTFQFKGEPYSLNHFDGGIVRAIKEGYDDPEN